jgi:hypothetical protein
MLGIKRQEPGGRRSPGSFWHAQSVQHTAQRELVLALIGANARGRINSRACRTDQIKETIIFRHVGLSGPPVVLPTAVWTRRPSDSIGKSVEGLLIGINARGKFPGSLRNINLVETLRQCRSPI